MEIVYIDYGIGNRVGDTIYLNEKLKENPKLHDAILAHELKHTPGYSVKDFALDLRNNEIEDVRWAYYKFILMNPRTLINYSPIMKLGDKWCIDLSLLIFWKITFWILVLIILLVI